jgi:hypothetical protein
MPARTRFFGRYGNVIVAMIVGLFALVGIGQGDFIFPLLSAGLLAAVAVSVHATERMAFLDSEEEWRRAEQREAELHREVQKLSPQVSEV